MDEQQLRSRLDEALREIGELHMVLKELNGIVDAQGAALRRIAEAQNRPRDPAPEPIRPTANRAERRRAARAAKAPDPVPEPESAG